MIVRKRGNSVKFTGEERGRKTSAPFREGLIGAVPPRSNARAEAHSCGAFSAHSVAHVRVHQGVLHWARRAVHLRRSALARPRRPGIGPCSRAPARVLRPRSDCSSSRLSSRSCAGASRRSSRMAHGRIPLLVFPSRKGKSRLAVTQNESFGGSLAMGLAFDLTVHGMRWSFNAFSLAADKTARDAGHLRSPDRGGAGEVHDGMAPSSARRSRRSSSSWDARTTSRTREQPAQPLGRRMTTARRMVSTTGALGGASEPKPFRRRRLPVRQVTEIEGLLI